MSDSARVVLFQNVPRPSGILDSAESSGLFGARQNLFTSSTCQMASAFAFLAIMWYCIYGGSMSFSQKRVAFLKRKKERYSRIGQSSENEIEEILKNEKDSRGESVFSKVLHHKKYGFKDRDGKDFTVYRTVGDLTLFRSFGVTISERSYYQAKVKHPATVSIYTPIGFNRDNFIKKVLALFND